MSGRNGRRRAAQSNGVLDRMRLDGWSSVAETTTDREEYNDIVSPAFEASKLQEEGEGRRMWQRVVDRASESVSGVAAAVRLKMRSEEDGLCGKLIQSVFYGMEGLADCQCQNPTKRTTREKVI